MNFVHSKSRILTKNQIRENFMKGVNWKTICTVALVFSVFFLDINNANARKDDAGNKPISPDEAYGFLVSEGLTCRAQEALLSFNQEQRSSLGRLVFDNFTEDELASIIEKREQKCFSVKESAQSGVKATSSISLYVTNPYTVEQIEETTGSGGYYPSSINRDSSTYDWMCNASVPESPADYVAQFYVPNSYNNLSRLKIRGTHSFASCYITNPTAARVYSDNYIRACYGYWTVYFCTLGTAPTTYESVIWIQ